MSVLVLTLIILLGAFLAGLIGSLTGLGGGVIIIPLLTLVLKVDIHYAIGASLVSVIATSSGSAAAYVKEGISNIRVGMFLEIATTVGAVIGAFIAVYAETNMIAVIFGLVLVLSAALSFKKHAEIIASKPNRLAALLKLNSSYPTAAGEINYTVQHVPGGFFMMMIAGVLSGLLGIGSGALKVLAMDNIMKLPFKVSTTTSNFMIGVTAAASAGVYFERGYIDPGLAMPVMLGVLAGAFAGSKILVKAQTKSLRVVFAIVITFLAIQMIYNGLNGKI
ncbi:TSUP family transporter [Pedobacter sp. HMF7647]|uniref:Probable membrane transporter protein n=1 Tax=Hufsiella arboris TaxID=2695275 RepID=A0A7K1Y5X1_9SPHI|nr:sulfite exporter TauE/SafE family protein [Hufsiella arboris]MXV49977.1 TSUP family transporter [Hufsiella arboris]